MLTFGVPEALSRFIPRLQREVRRRRTSWEQILFESLNQQKYLPRKNDKAINIFVISLKRAHERKYLTARSLELQNLSYKEYNAIDGLRPLSRTYVATYAGRKKTKRLMHTANLSYSELVKLHTKYRFGELTDQVVRASLHERLQFGCYMSHILLWKTMLQEDLDYIVVLEDDVMLTTDFAAKIRGIIAQLPQKWGILYLNGTERKFGGKYGAGVYQSRGGVGAFAYAISRFAATYFLKESAMKSDKPIDHVLDEAVLSGKLLAFHASPELANLVPNMPSTLAYKY